MHLKFCTLTHFPSLRISASHTTHEQNGGPALGPNPQPSGPWPNCAAGYRQETADICHLTTIRRRLNELPSPPIPIRRGSRELIKGRQRMRGSLARGLRRPSHGSGRARKTRADPWTEPELSVTAKHHQKHVMIPSLQRGFSEDLLASIREYPSRRNPWSQPLSPAAFACLGSEVYN